jgi:hypothetical protein
MNFPDILVILHKFELYLTHDFNKWGNNFKTEANSQVPNKQIINVPQRIHSFQMFHH